MSNETLRHQTKTKEKIQTTKAPIRQKLAPMLRRHNREDLSLSDDLTCFFWTGVEQVLKAPHRQETVASFLESTNKRTVRHLPPTLAHNQAWPPELQVIEDTMNNPSRNFFFCGGTHCLRRVALDEWILHHLEPHRGTGGIHQQQSAGVLPTEPRGPLSPPHLCKRKHANWVQRP